MQKYKRDLIVVKVNLKERVSCPTKEHETWNFHPRVYINLKSKTNNTCPYCGTIFKLYR